MRGTPVWLASVSRHNPTLGRLIATQFWSDPLRDEMAELLRRVLGPAGDPERERLFRMNATLCLHRALRVDEIARLPASFHAAEAVDLAGGPVEILWETEEGSASTRPCHAPHKRYLDGRDPFIWVPLDCGHCPPCLARAALDVDLAEKRARLARMTIAGA